MFISRFEWFNSLFNTTELYFRLFLLVYDSYVRILWIRISKIIHLNTCRFVETFCIINQNSATNLHTLNISHILEPNS